MGCITSKAITRTMSIREDYFNHGFQSRAVIWEELLASQNGNDTTTNTQKTGGFILPSRNSEKAVEPQHIADTRNIVIEKEEKAEVQDISFGKLTRSKSCQIRRETEMLGPDTEANGSISFHTVEEYDALLERIHNRGQRSSRETFEDYLSSLDLKSQNLKSLEEKIMENEISSSSRNLNNFGEGFCEKGWKRKTTAKGLKSLDVSTVEFPAIARLEQWIHVEGQVYSPGTYITPKFGSYNSKVNPRLRKEKGSEKTVFSAELIAAFEDYMQQLQVEEETILRDMDANTLVNETGEES